MFCNFVLAASGQSQKSLPADVNREALLIYANALIDKDWGKAFKKLEHDEPESLTTQNLEEAHEYAVSKNQPNAAKNISWQWFQKEYPFQAQWSQTKWEYMRSVVYVGAGVILGYCVNDYFNKKS